MVPVRLRPAGDRRCGGRLRLCFHILENDAGRLLGDRSPARLTVARPGRHKRTTLRAIHAHNSLQNIRILLAPAFYSSTRVFASHGSPTKVPGSASRSLPMLIAPPLGDVVGADDPEIAGVDRVVEQVGECAGSDGPPADPRVQRQAHSSDQHTRTACARRARSRDNAPMGGCRDPDDTQTTTHAWFRQAATSDAPVLARGRAARALDHRRGRDDVDRRAVSWSGQSRE